MRRGSPAGGADDAPSIRPITPGLPTVSGATPMGRRPQRASVNWDDLRILSAFARETSVAAVSRRLGIDQSTVNRRLRALEHAIGMRLLDRTEGRASLTALGLRALERAACMERDVAEILQSAETEAEEISGVVRLTSVAAVNSDYLVHHLRELYERHPGIVVDLVSSDEKLDVARREADLAVRVSRPESGDLIIRKLVEVDFAIYEAARPQFAPEPGDWVAYSSDLGRVPEMRWLESRLGDGRIRLHGNDTRTLCGALANGIGRGLLPVMSGDAHPDLRRCAPGGVVLTKDLWLVMNREARESRRVAAVADWLIERFAADARLFQPVPRDLINRNECTDALTPA